MRPLKPSQRGDVRKDGRTDGHTKFPLLHRTSVPSGPLRSPPGPLPKKEKEEEKEEAGERKRGREKKVKREKRSGRKKRSGRRGRRRR